MFFADLTDQWCGCALAHRKFAAELSCCSATCRCWLESIISYAVFCLKKKNGEAQLPRVGQLRVLTGNNNHGFQISIIATAHAGRSRCQVLSLHRAALA